MPSQNLYQVRNNCIRQSPKKRKREEPNADYSDNADVASECVKQQKEYKSNHEDILKAFRNSQKTISRLRMKIKELRSIITILKLKNNSKTDLSSQTLKPLFQSQFKLNKVMKKGRRYSEADKQFALSLHYCSPKSYRFLQKHFCLPATRSIRRWLQNLAVTPGLNYNVLRILKLKADLLPLEERVIAVAIDEMSLKEYASYNSQSDILEGFADYGIDFPDFLKSKKVDALANQGLVVMIRGLRRNFKQIIGYFVSVNSINGKILKDIVLHSLKKLVLVCDQGPNNLQMHRLLNISEDRPYLEILGNSIYIFLDSPHLLKSIRNNFKKYQIENNKNIISWSYV